MLNRIIYIKYVYLYKMDLALNNLQSLISHKTQPTIKNEVLFLDLFLLHHHGQQIVFFPLVRL